MEHAEAALKFIGACMVDESKQHKVIQVPTRAEMELDNKLQSDQFNPKDIKELFKSIMPESMLKNFDDSSFNPFSMLKSID